jgi:aldose 1-epimerase
MPELVTLQAGDLTLQLHPETGGSIARLRLGDTDLLRPAGDAEIAARDPRQLGSYPLFPFSNRVRHGRFPFQGRTYQLALNFGDHPHAIHGNAWQRPWRLDSQDGASARISFAHDPGRDGAAAWPFAYSATQSFRIAPDGVDVELTLRNDDARPAPAAFGLHPYFPKTPQTRLTARLSGMWRADATLIPVEHGPLPPALDFNAGRALRGVECDNCFTGWSGPAAIDWPERRLRLSLEASPEFGNLVIYVPPGRDFFAVEPVTNINDALNLAAAGVKDTGLVVLAPGATLAGSVRVRVAQT